MPVFLPLPGNEALAARLAERTAGVLGNIETRRFPDRESYIRILSELRGEEVFLICTLAAPDAKLLPLLFAAATARRLGGRRLTLIAPYLAYLRQDAIFRPGEALTSRDFAGLVSAAFDRVVTVDPHLHRYHSLSEVYSCATTVLHAAPLLGTWISGQVQAPLIVGPDEESEQWAAEIAAAAAAPHLVFRKTRLGDRNVRLEAADLGGWVGRQPVLVDDIVSSGATVAEAARALRSAGLAAPVCVAVHGLFDDEARARLAGPTQDLVTTDSVPNPTSRIPLDELIASAL